MGVPTATWAILVMIKILEKTVRTILKRIRFPVRFTIPPRSETTGKKLRLSKTEKGTTSEITDKSNTMETSLCTETKVNDKKSTSIDTLRTDLPVDGQVRLPVPVDAPQKAVEVPEMKASLLSS